jgi:hypothetical protein
VGGRVRVRDRSHVDHVEQIALAQRQIRLGGRRKVVNRNATLLHNNTHRERVRGRERSKERKSEGFLFSLSSLSPLTCCTVSGKQDSSKHQEHVDESTPLMSVSIQMDSAAQDAEVAKKKEEKRRSNMLIFSFVVMVFVGLGNKIFNKLQTLPMHNYPYFLSLLTTFIYVPAR